VQLAPAPSFLPHGAVVVVDTVYSADAGPDTVKGVVPKVSCAVPVFLMVSSWPLLAEPTAIGPNDDNGASVTGGGTLVPVTLSVSGLVAAL
jgi:hypothetical protein